MRGLTQERLGELAEIQAETMSRIENAVNTPDLETLARIARVLNVSIAAMFPIDLTVDDPDPTLTDVMLADWQKLEDHDRRLVTTFVGRLAAVTFRRD
jgi:transcriptional regulator with XRE-family HTH domain